MEISTAPHLLKILQPKVRTKAIQSTITPHTHTHTHTSSFKNYMPPKYTCQKAENQTIGASFARALSLSLSLSLSPSLSLSLCFCHCSWCVCLLCFLHESRYQNDRSELVFLAYAVSGSVLVESPGSAPQPHCRRLGAMAVIFVEVAGVIAWWGGSVHSWGWWICSHQRWSGLHSTGYTPSCL